MILVHLIKDGRHTHCERLRQHSVTTVVAAQTTCRRCLVLAGIVCATPEKIAYHSRRAAVKGLKSMHRKASRRDDIRVRGLEVYACECGKWHLGHKKIMTVGC